MRIDTVRRDLYYHEVEYVRGLEAEIGRLRDLLAWSGINPDAIVESAKGAAQKLK